MVYISKKNLKKGTKIELKNLYSAIPYQKEIGHITSRDYFDNDFILNKDMKKDAPLSRNDIL